jgi:Flp pilus assembly protein TadD
VELLRPTDTPAVQADALADLAEVLARRGRNDDARAALEEAVTLYERKGNVVSMARARSLLDALVADVPAG